MNRQFWQNIIFKAEEKAYYHRRIMQLANQDFGRYGCDASFAKASKHRDLMIRYSNIEQYARNRLNQ